MVNTRIFADKGADLTLNSYSTVLLAELVLVFNNGSIGWAIRVQVLFSQFNWLTRTVPRLWLVVDLGWKNSILGVYNSNSGRWGPKCVVYFLKLISG